MMHKLTKRVELILGGEFAFGVAVAVVSQREDERVNGSKAGPHVLEKLEYGQNIGCVKIKSSQVQACLFVISTYMVYGN